MLNQFLICMSTAVISFSISNFTAPSTGELEITTALDGDTLKATTQTGFRLDIRLDGIDAPESKQNFGYAATAALETLCAGKTAQIIEKGSRSFGRITADVYCDKIYVNAYLVEHGFAWSADKYARGTKLPALEKRAAEQCLGLWKSGNAIPPWNFRDTNKVKPESLSPKKIKERASRCKTSQL